MASGRRCESGVELVLDELRRARAAGHLDLAEEGRDVLLHPTVQRRLLRMSLVGGSARHRTPDGAADRRLACVAQVETAVVRGSQKAPAGAIALRGASLAGALVEVIEPRPSCCRTDRPADCGAEVTCRAPDSSPRRQRPLLAGWSLTISVLLRQKCGACEPSARASIAPGHGPPALRKSRPLHAAAAPLNQAEQAWKWSAQLRA